MILNCDFLELAKSILTSSVDLVIADWPFDNRMSTEQIEAGIKEAARLINDKGNFISVHYLKHNINITHICEKEKLILRDHIILETRSKSKRKGYLGKALLSIFVFSKNENRIFNDASTFSGKFFCEKKFNIVTDFWKEKQFRNGFYRKKYEEQVPEAMAEWTVRKILDLYTEPGSKIVDYFGGSGNFPIVCLERGLDCIASELNSNRYLLINQRLIDYAMFFINKAISLTDTKPKENTWQNRQAEKRDKEKQKKLDIKQVRQVLLKKE